MAYLKTHYPLEYFSVLLSTSENSVDKVSLYVQSAHDIGISVTPPSINDSDYSFQIKNKSIIFGFSSIKGIGNETIGKILEARNSMKDQIFTNYTQAIGKLCNAGVGVKTLETLIKAGTFDALLKEQNRAFLLANLAEIYQKATTITTNGEFIIKPNLQEVKMNSQVQKELNDEQFNLLGVSFTEHPILAIKQKYQGSHDLVNLVTASSSLNVERSLVMLVSHRVIKTKTNQAMAFAKIEDDTKIMDVVIFPGVFEKVKSILINNNYFIVTLRATDRGYQALGFKEYAHE
jgi:DNA polymerase-3 subunit alpha